MPAPHTSPFIAVLLYPGCSLIDVAAPIERLAGLSSPYRLTTVAARIRPIAAGGALRLLAERTFEELPHPAALYIPGGSAPAVAALADRELVDYVRRAGAGIAASVGIGTLLLAAAGHLEGRNAAAPAGIAGAIPSLSIQFLDQAVVEDGHTLTAAGSFAATTLTETLGTRLGLAFGAPR